MSHRASSQRSVSLWSLQECTNQEGPNHHYHGGRNNSANSPRPKLHEREPIFTELSEKNPCDEITRNYKENVDAHKTARKPQLEVEQNHSNYRNSAKAIDFWAVVLTHDPPHP
jgi:hypothetical protein